MADEILSASLLRELLNYDPDTGIFSRRVRTSHRIKVGDVAGTPRPDGYLKVSVCNRSFLAHRLAWLYVYGEWPNAQIDHKNGVRSDNRIDNLRDLPPLLNQQNQRRAHIRNKSSGLLGVSWDGRKRKWVAQIAGTSRSRHVGYFDSPDAAHVAYLDAKRRMHEGCTI